MSQLLCMIACLHDTHLCVASAPSSPSPTVQRVNQVDLQGADTAGCQAPHVQLWAAPDSGTATGRKHPVFMVSIIGFHHYLHLGGSGGDGYRRRYLFCECTRHKLLFVGNIWDFDPLLYIFLLSIIYENPHKRQILYLFVFWETLEKD